LVSTESLVSPYLLRLFHHVHSTKSFYYLSWLGLSAIMTGIFRGFVLAPLRKYRDIALN
jgi:hypothetical protein